jgi:hypothetical protein
MRIAVSFQRSAVGAGFKPAPTPFFLIYHTRRVTKIQIEELLAKVIFHVIPAKLVPAGFKPGAGIQNCMKILDSGSPPAFAGGARNDDFLFLPRVLQEAQKRTVKGKMGCGERKGS